MSTEKGAVPVYTRVGICKECGAGVYAPEAVASGVEFRRMSACACEGGPKAGAGGLNLKSTPADKINSEAEKKAA